MSRTRVPGLFLVAMLTVLVGPVSASSLTINTSPDGRPVLLDAQRQGRSPVQLSLGSEQRQLKVSNGDTVWEGPVKLDGKAQLTLSLTGASPGRLIGPSCSRNPREPTYESTEH